MGWLVYNHTPACIRDEIARRVGALVDELDPTATEGAS